MDVDMTDESTNCVQIAYVSTRKATKSPTGNGMTLWTLAAIYQLVFSADHVQSTPVSQVTPMMPQLIPRMPHFDNPNCPLILHPSQLKANGIVCRRRICGVWRTASTDAQERPCLMPKAQLHSQTRFGGRRSPSGAKSMQNLYREENKTKIITASFRGCSPAM